MTTSLLKVFLSIILFLCVLEMPYVYFQFVRFAAFMGFSYLAYQSNQHGKTNEIMLYGGLALLFQPFFKIALGRELWNFVDVIVAIGLLWSLFQNDDKAK
ncbi:DUF6804 family protein [Flavobacterium sp. IMCC34518]|uniref:DUF6804 family protein n=1 Tax=Flavobacterium sp. IMCC34518 TaxID=3003623 RepID=UPI0022AC5CB2|nr:DUF6804 family protein [Flavobacterium sp. IMCC34518]